MRNKIDYWELYTPLLRVLGALCEDLLKVHTTQIRCIVEFAVAAWNGSITRAQIAQCALDIILGQG